MHGSNGHGAQKPNDMSYHLGELATVCQTDHPHNTPEGGGDWGEYKF